MRLALAGVTCGPALAACGSSSKPSTTASSGDPALKFAQIQISGGLR